MAPRKGCAAAEAVARATLLAPMASRSVRTSEQSWVPALQKELERAVRSTWDEEAPIILADVDKALQGTVGQA
jgi:hypothetical protein